MTTKTICDYPDCERTAVWKVELSDIRPHAWGDLSFSFTSSSPKRTSVDSCEKHLVRVSFDPDEIAEFQKAKKAAA